MYIKKIKRKCGVRGCKNTETYAISKTREMGNSIIACKECLIEVLNTIEEQNKPVAKEEVKPITENVKEEVTEETPEQVIEDKPKQTRQRKSK